MDFTGEHNMDIYPSQYILYSGVGISYTFVPSFNLEKEMQGCHCCLYLSFNTMDSSPIPTDMLVCTTHMTYTQGT